MAKRLIPSPNSIASLLGMLIGRDITATERKPPRRPWKKPAMVATYVDPDGDTGAVVLCTLPAAASLGAALSLLPASRADENATAGELDELLLDNYREVCNVVTQLVSTPIVHDANLPGLALKDLVHVPPEPSGDLKQAAESATGKVAVDISLDGYTGGTLVFLMS